MKLQDHPTVQRWNATGRTLELLPTAPPALDAEELRTLCFAAGADDVGFVAVDRPALAEERDAVRKIFPRARTFISLVGRMNRDAIRTPARSLANVEFHHAGDHIDEVGRRIVRALGERGVGGLVPPVGFPMEMDRFPDRIWVVSHKPVAVEAGLGRIGIHRNLIHPRFGNFVLLGTVVIDAEVSEQGAPIDYNPCLECKLCVAACPVGAIGADGHFAFSACMTHNYREFMAGFTSYVEEVADAPSATTESTCTRPN